MPGHHTGQGTVVVDAVGVEIVGQEMVDFQAMSHPTTEQGTRDILEPLEGPGILLPVVGLGLTPVVGRGITELGHLHRGIGCPATVEGLTTDGVEPGGGVIRTIGVMVHMGCLSVSKGSYRSTG